MLRTASSLPLAGLLTLGFDPTRFQMKPPACYRATWQLPEPDSHRQATTSLRTANHLHRQPPVPLDARKIEATAVPPKSQSGRSVRSWKISLTVSICHIPTATTRRNRARARLESEPHDLGGLPLSRLRGISPGSDNSHVFPGLLSTFSRTEHCWQNG